MYKEGKSNIYSTNNANSSEFNQM